MCVRCACMFDLSRSAVGQTRQMPHHVYVYAVRDTSNSKYNYSVSASLRSMLGCELFLGRATVFVGSSTRRCGNIKRFYLSTNAFWDGRFSSIDFRASKSSVPTWNVAQFHRTLKK